MLEMIEQLVAAIEAPQKSSDRAEHLAQVRELLDQVKDLQASQEEAKTEGVLDA